MEDLARTTGGKIGEVEIDNLMSKLYPPADTMLIKLKTPGIYKRGTVMSLESDGDYAVLGAGSGKARVVLSDDTEESDAFAPAFRSGHFNRNALIVSDGYELTAADEDELHLAGIFLSDNIQNAHAYENGVYME